MNNIYSLLNNAGFKFVIAPIGCLQDIKNDIEKLKSNTKIGELQKWVINDNYVLSDVDLHFKPKSIIMTAKPHELKRIVFNYQGRTVTDILNVWPSNIKDTTMKIFRDNRYNIACRFWLPSKRLAVRAGLSEYGRNNITYIKDWGSFFEHASFFSDIEPDKNYIWREVKCMEYCKDCNACLEACPTGAILKDRFLIDPDICISNFNEHGTEPFPDFIPKEAHCSIVDCLHCQKICPLNQTVLKKVNETVEFSESETDLLLKGVKLDNLPGSLRTKVQLLSMNWFYESIPRNLKALLYNAI